MVSLEEQANEELIGPFFVGIIINYILWGIQITQSYYYYTSYRKTDRTWLKTAVGLLFVADFIQSICVSEGVWRFVVDGWGDPNLVNLPLSVGFDLIPFMDAVTASIVHAFYAQKTWTLLHAPYNYIGTATVLIMSCFQLATGIGCTAFMLSININLTTFYRLKTWACLWLVTASVTDIVITIIMAWKLSMSRTGFKKTDDIITKLIRLTVETGLAPAIGQILDLIIYLIWPGKAFHVTLTLLDPKIYSNSMMALLNSRQPRITPEVWDSRQGNQSDSIQIRTTKTVVTSNDYGVLNPAFNEGSSTHSRDDGHSAAIDLENFPAMHSKGGLA